MNEKKKSLKLDLLFADDIMSENVVVINSNMTIGQVAHLMLRERVSGYPVVDENGGVCGLVTLTDFFVLLDKIAHVPGEEMESRIKECKDLPISEIMTKEVFTITPETPISDVVEEVVSNGIHTFPVMKEGKLVGIVGRHDVLNAVFIYG